MAFQIGTIVSTMLLWSSVIFLTAHQGCGQSAPVAKGMWGGRSIALDIEDDGATLDFDCADGKIASQVKVSRDGTFGVDGTFTPHHGGPVRIDEPDTTRPARYSGTVIGKSMTLSITDSKTGEKLGNFTLELGAQPRIHRCL